MHFLSFIQATADAISLRGKEGEQCPQPCRKMMVYFGFPFITRKGKTKKYVNCFF